MFVLGRKMVQEELMFFFSRNFCHTKSSSTSVMSAPLPVFPNLHSSFSMFNLGRRLVFESFDVFLLENSDDYQAMVPVVVNSATTMLREKCGIAASLKNVT
jgi:hypothetical protein